MWLAVAVAAVGAGLNVFSSIRQNNTLKSTGSNAVAQAQAETELGVLKSDAAYLGGLAQSIDATDEANQKRATIEANKKKLRTVGIVGGIALLGILAVVAVTRRQS